MNEFLKIVLPPLWIDPRSEKSDNLLSSFTSSSGISRIADVSSSYFGLNDSARTDSRSTFDFDDLARLILIFKN